MSNASQYTLSLKITADASQHNAAFSGAAQAAKGYGAGVQASANAASAGLQGVIGQAERVAPVLTQATTSAEVGLKNTKAAGQALAQTLGSVGDAAQKAGTASAQGFNQATMSAKQYQAALRGVPAQFTDIFTSIASGQAPLTVLMQQGGQLKDMFGGAGDAARALGGYVMGLVTPLTATAAAVAVLVAGFYAGGNESRALQNAIINSGNAAGVTQGQLMGMAAGVDAVVGTQGRAVEVLGAFVATGKVGAANIEAFTTAAIRFEAVGGAAAEDTAKSFAELGKAPVEASLKLNDSMGYLTVSTYKQIKALVDQGKHTEAAEVAQKAFADTLNSRSGQMEANLGLVEKGWKGIKWAVTEAWDAIKNIGRDAGPEGRLEVLGKKITEFEANIAARKSEGHDVSDREARLAKMREEQALLQKKVGTSQALSAEEARQVQLTKDQAEWDKRGEKYKTDQQKLEAAISSERLLSQGLINAGLMTEKQLADRISAIREEYAKKGSKSGAGDTELANLVAKVAAERQNLALLQTQGLHYDKLNDGERTALQLAEQLTGKLDAKTRISKEAQLVQAKTLSDVLNQQQVERELQQARTAAAALDEKLTTQQIGQYQQSIDQLVTGNEQLRTEIALIGKDAAARREYLALKAQEVITAKELEVINLRNAGSRQEVIDKAEQELRLLRDKASLTVQVNSAQDGQAAKDMLTAIQRETEALSQSNEQRQVTTALRELETKGIKAGSAAYEEYIPKIKAAISGKAVAEQSVAFWSSVENVAHDAWNHIGEQGESAAERIKRALKAGVWDMLWQITAKRWLIDIGASMGVPGAALAQSQGGTGGNAIGTAANLYNLYGAAGKAGGFIGSLGSAATYGTAIGSQQGAMLAAQEMGMGTFAGSMGSIGAALPWIGGAVALVSLIKSLDDSGTMHTGGAALADSISGVREIQAATIGFGLAAADVSGKVVGSSKQLAGSALSILQGLDQLSGGKSKFSVSTGFADDSSKDGAWGSLAITRDGQSLVDWRDTQTSRWAPKEFADGEAGAKQYGDAVATGIKQAIDKIDLPDWAANIVKYLGDSPSMEELSAAMAKIQAMPEQMLQAIGTSSQALSGVIYTGMQAGDPAGAGAAFASQITYGIESSLYSGFSQQITGIISTQLVTPVVTAMASGATITQAMASVSVDAMKAQVAAAGTAFAAIVNDPAFKGALASLGTLISSTVSGSVAGLSAPTAPVAYTGQATAAAAATTATTGLSNAVDQLRQKAESAVDSLKSTSAGLEIDLLRAQGNEMGALSKERANYLAQYADLTVAEQGRIAQLYDGNQAIRDQITYLEKADAVSSQKVSLERQLLEIQGDTVALRSLELAEIEPGNRAILARIHQLQDEKTAAENASAAAEKLRAAIDGMYSAADSTASSYIAGDDLNRYRLTRIAEQVNAAVGGGTVTAQMLDTLGIEQIQRAVIDFVSSNAAPEAKTALIQLGASLIDIKQTAIDAAAATAAASASQQLGLQLEIARLNGDTAAIREHELSLLDGPLNRALQRHVWLLQDQAAAAEKAAAVATERTGIERQWLNAIGATGELRRRELEALDPTNRSLQELVYRIGDLGIASDAANARVDASYAGLQKSLDAEKKVLAQRLEANKEALAAQAEAAQGVVGSVKSIFDAITSAIKSTAVESDSLSRTARQSAFETLQTALTQARSGMRVDTLTGITDALSVLTKPSDKLYARFDDYARTQDAASDVMRQLGDQSAGQLSVAELTLSAMQGAAKELEKAYQRDVDALDKTAEQWRTTIDVQRGTYVGVMSLKDAIDVLRTDLTAALAAKAAVQIASMQPALAAPAPGGLVGAGSGTGVKASPVTVPGLAAWVTPGDTSDKMLSYATVLGYYGVVTDAVKQNVWTAAGLDGAPKFATGAAFAGGGIVQRPTHFDIGQMAEEGPEAIMPLANINGKLGILAQGGGGSPEMVAAILAQNVLLSRIAAAAEAGAMHGYGAARATQELVDRGVKVMPGLKPLVTAVAA